MKKILNIMALFIGIQLFFSCASQDTRTSSSRINNNTDLIVYTLARGENLSTFITSQNRLNEYAIHEHEPSETIFREMFIEISDKLENLFEETLREFSEDDLKEFHNEFPNVTIEEFFDVFRRIGFIYTIEYNRNTRVWYVDLIGRSTSLYLIFTSNREFARNNDLRYYHNAIPHINRWMELNNVLSLDYVIRMFLDYEQDDLFTEIIGVRF